ncbi:similar to Saccharomyces cerevisiae YJL134W LCB3 Long-chain base-1-phosphate phosphatase with specificity for dihydrosphingosine-1-phosphate [Maudiozyma saulgeensis]|uniref:Similar to Saccharomyces cerevisiae YJL134W LCB3 Long-chain base-1-phosphate phosphatase with specificity for dihydrosphingosine-1-phosphate n=1 Tax=Maudiozyma saulgeensis TaxID=1789683 RepID=A0A1X7RC68_9SACH|nr:similar to Saccharomyces cerevisiae YJL134W LCB3 Long-chain base-1-phosphate phosphatase with specificity for dihydrosphingosine-1-phosphate [Kazachstania saulgeensis]
MDEIIMQDRGSTSAYNINAYESDTRLGLVGGVDNSTVTRIRSRSLSNPNEYTEKYLLLDPGNHPSSHFKDKMSPLRFNIRQYFIKFVDNQSSSLAKWQTKHRSPINDIFFSYSALLGSHTFYVLCLPLPCYFGLFEFTRDTVYIIGYSIYLSGLLKDYLCLPRPRSPPVHRITLSEYTAKEYGAPSSHTANAIGVSLLILQWAFTSNTVTLNQKIILTILAIVYCLTLTIGRIYCGMHGLFDLVSGALVGLICFLIRMILKYTFINFNCGRYFWYPIISVCWGLTILFNHPSPIDVCPCFYDSVAFVGVISGIELCDWFIKFFGFSLVYSFDFTTNILIMIRRLIVGILVTVIWKYLIGKPLINFFLLKILKFIDDRDLDEHDEPLPEDHECKLFKGNSNVNIVGRFLIYAGVPMSVLLLSPPAITFVANYIY